MYTEKDARLLMLIVVCYGVVYGIAYLCCSAA